MAAPKGHPPYPGCETGGRPKIYDEEFIDRQADALEKWIKLPENIWLNDFCLEQSLDPDLMSDWAKKHVKFSGIYKLAKRDQEAKIYKGALNNKYNSQMAKMGLTNHHGWRDQAHTTLANDPVNPITGVLALVIDTSKHLVADEEE